MKQRLVNWLSCPRCGGDLSLNVYDSEDDEIIDGLLVCDACASSFPVHRGVPRLGVSPAYGDPEFEARYRNEVATTLMGSCQGVASPAGSDSLTAIRSATATSFGYEWKAYARHGWEGKVPGETAEWRQALERTAFFNKAIVGPEEFDGKLVLDAGCGNGRYLYQAAELGAEVVGIDLSEAADVAYANIGRHHPRVHVVQGDLFNLPFRPRTFDRIFSIGVLMHTGDAQAAFMSIAERVAPGGMLSVHVYRRGNVVYEAVDAALRKRTTQMDHARLMRWSIRAQPIPKAVLRTKRFTGNKPVLYQLMNCFIRLESAHHNIFDWYSAPVASHHTYDEVSGWMWSAGLEPIADRSPPSDAVRRMLKSPAGGVTVKGRVRG